MFTTFNTVVQSTCKTIATSVSCAIVAALSLATISIALIVAAVNPAMNGQAIAAVAGLLILAMAAVVATMSMIFHRFRTITSNDDLVYRDRSLATDDHG